MEEMEVSNIHNLFTECLQLYGIAREDGMVVLTVHNESNDRRSEQVWVEYLVIKGVIGWASSRNAVAGLLSSRRFS